MMPNEFTKSEQDEDLSDEYEPQAYENGFELDDYDCAIVNAGI